MGWWGLTRAKEGVGCGDAFHLDKIDDVQAHLSICWPTTPKPHIQARHLCKTGQEGIVLYHLQLSAKVPRFFNGASFAEQGNFVFPLRLLLARSCLLAVACGALVVLEAPTNTPNDDSVVLRPLLCLRSPCGKLHTIHKSTPGKLSPCLASLPQLETSTEAHVPIQDTHTHPLHRVLPPHGF